MTENAGYTREYLDIVDSLNGDLPSRRAAHAYMESSTAIVHGKRVVSSYVPRFFDQRTYNEFKRVAEATHCILCKVMRRYLDDPSYRTIFDYEDRLRELILLPRGYDALLPFARVDVFMNEDTLTCGFCELNADGSSGMNEDRELNASFAASAALKEFGTRHRLQASNLFDTWVEEFARIYETYEHKRTHPRIAIVDFLDHAVIDEFEAYARCFAQHGYDCMIADVRDLHFDGEALRTSDGRRIDAIWRRCVTNDILEFWDQSQPLIEAVRAEKVALIGSFAGHIVHDKQIFDALSHPLTKAFLTPEENALVEACIPQTKFLDDAHTDIAEVRASKDRWIIKPTDQYGASDVYAGKMHTQDEWDALIDRFANGAAGAPFLVQTYLSPFKTDVLPPCLDIASREDAEVPQEIEAYNNLNGLYLFNGTFAGVFSRLGPEPIISEPMGDLTSATIWVDCDVK